MSCPLILFHLVLTVGKQENANKYWLCLFGLSVQVVGGAWLFSRLYCNVFVTLDVMMCTASILNLCAISIDRYWF